MKLKLFLAFTICLLLSQNSHAQLALKDTLKYEVVYDFSYQENKEDTLSKKSEQMILKIAKNFSFYISSSNMKLWTFYNQNKNATLLPEGMAVPKVKSQNAFTVTKDYVNDKMIFSDKIATLTYCFSQKLNQFNWTLHKERKEILGYQCNKATMQFAGREYTAWYAPEISISDGPYKFRGLPGLIFSIYDSHKHYSFTIASIKKDTTYLNTQDEFFKHIEITDKDYKTLKQKYREKPSTLMNSGGMSFPQEMLDMADKRAKDKLKYENNPIELTD